ncbi:zinc finger BED domain-containing protein RICESLEEPER 2-like [Rhizophagus irregularis DAOM 181602=DAOM 197198]|nr:zinc finger BED domain-containing protein RICESLEEPER 2-like [Rhizophagus irregularis DAOM 181602=DAOM 197198]
MSTERTIEIRLQSEDNYIDIIDIENLTPPENLLPPLEDTNSIEEYTKNAFDKLLDKEHNLNFQTKSKGGSKLQSWIYNWGERKNYPTNSNKYIFECNQKLDNGENCAAQIETSGPTGNIISHLNRKHKIYEHSKPLSTITPSLKQQYIHENAASVSLTCDLWTSRSKQGFLGVTCHFITPDFEIREITLAIQYLEYPHTGNAIQQAAITDVETWWSSTYIVWERLIALKPYIDIVISFLNVSKDNNAKEDAKRLNKINLTNNEWDIIRDLLEILGPFAELTEILEEVDEDDEPDARRKIKINTPINTFGLLDNIKSNLYKALENYFEVIEKEALIAALLDPRKKKTMFANNDRKELAKANFREVYELAKNDTNIHLEKCEPKLKKRKTSTRVYKRSLFSDDESHDLQTEDNEVERYLVMV